MMERKIRVLLVDDHSVVRNGVRLMLGTASDIVVTGEAESAAEAIRLVREQDFDVAMLDISMPGKNGLELLKLMHAEKPKLAILMLSMYSEELYAVRAIKHGAAGYLTKASPASTLITAVRKAAAGGKHVSRALAEQLANILVGAGQPAHEALSDRELEVLKLIASGETLVEIGKKLNLSPSTVTTYRARILEKTKLKSNAKLALYALENGLLS